MCISICSFFHSKERKGEEIVEKFGEKAYLLIMVTVLLSIGINLFIDSYTVHIVLNSITIVIVIVLAIFVYRYDREQKRK
ncbi:hypothetical protein [Priestia koreensis]|uniref:hypothetical protein n=1 Tax=Priestia koreensis TaxID=284581 RepID=UPI00203B5C69|nr:hypothetical protein [Priestia koreensis]MCM3004607.1 hypothetical protein [Priestia koreensis]